MGGTEEVNRQHDAGHLTVRERIDRLLDSGSFHEIGALAGRMLSDESFVPAKFVMGKGTIDGRRVIVGGDDFAVRGGAADASRPRKQVLAEQLAGELRVPLITLVDSTGARSSATTWPPSPWSTASSITSTCCPRTERNPGLPRRARAGGDRRGRRALPSFGASSASAAGSAGTGRARKCLANTAASSSDMRRKSFLPLGISMRGSDRLRQAALMAGHQLAGGG
jgi:hypothetical protein